MQEWFSRLPLWGVFFVMAATVLVLGSLLSLLLDPAGFGSDRILGRAPQAVVIAAAATAGIAFRRRRDGQETAAIERAMRTGEVPAGVEGDKWLDALRARHRLLDRGMWLIPVTMLPLAALVLVFALSGPEIDLRGIVLATVTAAIAALAVAQNLRYRPRLDRAIAELESRRDAAPPASAVDEVVRDDG